ncbi:MAG TPA: MFS transporter [Candidatus Limnocylindrales bacterium]|nr:MFS transporter [Candidatus Limnocylindrales bacterium]
MPAPRLPTAQPNRPLILGALSTAVFMVLLNLTVVNVNLPDIQRSLHTDTAGLEWVVNAYTLPLACLLMLAGSLGDRIGRKPVLLVGLGIFALGSLVCALAPSIGVLLAGRLLQGVGAATVLPSSLAIISAVYPDPRERAQAIGVWAGMNGLALAAGPLVGGVLGDRFGWPSVFLINVPVGMLAVTVGALALPPSAPAPDDRPGIDPAGQLLTLVWIGALTFALIESAHYGWTSPLIAGLLIAAALGCAGFILLEQRVAQPMVPLRFFRVRSFTGANLVGASIFFALQGALFFLSIYFQDVQHRSAIEAGLRLSPVTAAFMVMAPIAGRLAGRFGPRLPITVGLVFSGAGLLLLHGLMPSTPYADVWWRLLLVGVGFALTLAPMTAAVLSSVPVRRAGTASAIHTAARQTGGLFGVAVLGAIAGGARDFTAGMDIAFVVGGCVVLGAVLITLALIRSNPRPSAR